jgi:uncharacterized RDD family membrane protein YckC
MYYARLGQRAAAFVIDVALISLVTVIVGVLLEADWSSLFSGDRDPAAQVLDAVFFLVAWLYSAPMECSRKQATLGKLALGIQVTDLDGERVSFHRATGRFFGKILSTLILALGYLMAAFTQRRQALHDRMAGALVVTR